GHPALAARFLSRGHFRSGAAECLFQLRLAIAVEFILRSAPHYGLRAQWDRHRSLSVLRNQAELSGMAGPRLRREGAAHRYGSGGAGGLAPYNHGAELSFSLASGVLRRAGTAIPG